MAELSHVDFVNLYKLGKLKVHIDKSKSNVLLQQSKNAPGNYKAASHLWVNIGCLGIIAGLASFFFIKWYYSCLILIVAMIICSGSRQGDAQNALNLALKNEGFYFEALDNGTLTYEEAESV